MCFSVLLCHAVSELRDMGQTVAAFVAFAPAWKRRSRCVTCEKNNAINQVLLGDARMYGCTEEIAIDSKRAKEKERQRIVSRQH